MWSGERSGASVNIKRAVELVGGEAVEDVGETLGFGVLGGEVVGTVAAGDAVAEIRNEAVGAEGGQRRWVLKRNGTGGVERVRAEVEVLFGLRCGRRCAGMNGGGVLEFLVLAGDVADDADGGVDGAHGPAGKAVEPLPVVAEDALAQFVDQLWCQQRGALLAALVDLREKVVGKAWLSGELTHHLREQNCVGGHGGFRRRVGVMAAGGHQKSAQRSASLREERIGD